MSIDVMTAVQLAIKYGPMVKSIIDMAQSNADLTSKLNELSKPLATMIEELGAQLFPRAATDLHAVGGAVAAFDPDVTKWIQGALNVLLTPSPNLVVDGIYGARTRDAVLRLQQNLGLRMDGLAGTVTQAAIAAALAKKA